MKIGIFQWVSCVLVTISLQAWGAASDKTVVIISIDGGKPETILQTEMPVLKKMVKEGVHTWNAQTIVPSITLPSHTSMLTGVGPNIHQILWNEWDEERGVVKVPTVFGVARKFGLKTALFAGKEKFRHLDVRGTLDEFEVVSGNAEVVAARAAAYLASARPNLIFVHFKDADSAGHEHGWGSPKQKRALQAIDRGLGILKASVEHAGFADETVFLITADHGGLGHNHHEDIPANRTIPWIAWGTQIKAGCALKNRKVVTMDTAATALHILDIPVQKEWAGRAVTQAFRERSEAPYLASCDNM